MLPKKNKIPRKAFIKAFKKSRAVHSPFFTLLVSPLDDDENKYAFVISKKVAVHAATRNLLRRRGYALARKYHNSLQSPFAYLFIMKKDAGNASFRELDSEMQKAFEQGRLIR